MFIYFIFLSIAFIFSFIKETPYTKVTVSFLLLLIMGLRSESVGVDLNHYLELYHSGYFQNDFWKHPESGYFLFSKILKVINVNSVLFVFIMSFFIVYSLSVFINRYSKNFSFSFFLHVSIGLFVLSLSGLRQMIAICIILFSYKYILNKKLLNFIMVVLIASTFHKSALIFLPMYFIAQVRINTYQKMFSVLIISFILLSFRHEVGLLTEFLAIDKYRASYDVVVTSNNLNPLLLLINFCIYLFIPLMLCYTKQSISNMSKEFYVFYSSLAIIILLTVVFINSSITLRLSYYFIPSYIILIPNVIEGLEQKSNKLIIYFFIGLTCLIYFIMGNTGDIMQIDNYKFFFQD